ncbi:hypothetical protein FRC11_006614, partial [Ceratobasidium sp. 423]
MPLKVLYRSLLQFFDTPTFGKDTHPLDMLPWRNEQWCYSAKLEFPVATRRIRPIPEVYTSLTKSLQNRFADEKQELVVQFLTEIRNRVFEPHSAPKTVLDNVKHITGYGEYIKMVEVIFDDRWCGVSSLVWDVMVSMSYTPQAYFKDVYALNEASDGLLFGPTFYPHTASTRCPPSLPHLSPLSLPPCLSLASSTVYSAPQEAHKHGRGVPPDELAIPSSGGNSLCPAIVARQVFGEEAIGKNAQD